ncbi:sigma-70 family RNA polymerase sigma factor [Leptobacterium flavescens]|uniref:Sigma-70 family RNA polymerase sigma factor n=1 Tax=Leptobacterium flavescens TaxID=472055 RepID=A0A6P0UR77_9FLAO|nr:sigma-70 family RNA polymerase sigma factor [Leptobacterium flavescens]NER14518.1 sigma-70 family RNA polymerase sigma factor [Leptobacterium flavescens]
MEPSSTHPTIKALLNGDELTIRLLYDSLYPKVLSYVKNNKGTANDAEEVFHNGLFQLISRAKVKEVLIKSSFEAYFFTICRNLWLKELNKRKKEIRNEGFFELKEKDDNHLAAVIQQERWELFEEMINRLSENCSKLLKAYFNKVPYNIIVKKFSYATENAAFQRVHKCKKKLTELIKTDPRYKNLYTS